MKLLFLDIDGVLNTHRPHGNGYCGLDIDKLNLLDGIVERTGCGIVLASAWRYLILGGSMNIEGFRNLLLTHGATRRVASAIRDTLPKDGEPLTADWRGWACAERAKRRMNRRMPVVAIDDNDFGYTVAGVPLVQTSPDVGLTPELADEAAAILTHFADTGELPGEVGDEPIPIV